MTRQKSVHIFGTYAFDKATNGQTVNSQESCANLKNYLIESVLLPPSHTQSVSPGLGVLPPSHNNNNNNEL